jgi:hypothetical protein
MKKFVLYLLLVTGTTVFAQDKRLKVSDIMLENVQYPFPVKYLDLKIQGHDLKMAYMDVKPQKPNGKTVMLLHGKNFSGIYWETNCKRPG